MRWQTAEVQKLLSDLGTIHQSGPGGDYDGTTLTIYPYGSREWISVCPFTDNVTVENKDDLEATWVEVRTDGDSAGGLQTEDENVGATYGRIVARLIKKGFGIVPTYDGLF